MQKLKDFAAKNVSVMWNVVHSYNLTVVNCTKAIRRVTFKTQRFCPYALYIIHILGVYYRLVEKCKCVTENLENTYNIKIVEIMTSSASRTLWILMPQSL
jgi:hypothetical protein